MKRKTCFYKWLVAVVVLICSTTTMSAQTKVTSVNQLKAGCVIKIYPKDKFGYSDEALACSGDGQSLNLYFLAGSGDEWTLEDAGDGSCYIKNDKGCYWAYQGVSDEEDMKCTINKSSAVKVRLTWNSKYGGVYFWNDIDGSGLNCDECENWWAYPNEYDNYDYEQDNSVFEIALIKEGNGRDFVQEEMATVVDGIKYSLDAKQKTAKVIVNNHSYTGDIVIPANITYENVTYKVNALGVGCFAGCDGLTNVTLPVGITSLGGRCFYNCNSLKSIDLPDGITSLGDYCFSGCESLTSVSLPKGITSLGNYCFANCNSLTSIDLPDCITSLGEYCFWRCSSMSGVSLPEGITSLGIGCFRGCSSLTSIDLSAITSLGTLVLADCSNLKNVKLPSGITSLGEGFFEGCSSLENIDLPSGITSLGKGCFDGCSSLASIDLPSGITSLGEGCFYGCSSLTNISLPLGLTTLEGSSTSENTDMGCGPDGCDEITSYRNFYGCFSYCSSLKSINLPSGITSLGKGCFAECSSLTDIDLSCITSLGDLCFMSCVNLKSVSLPTCVASLGQGCFYRCTGLASVYMYAEHLPTMLGYNVFGGCDADNCILYVPKGTMDMYRQSSAFGYFKNIVELDATDINNPATSTNLKEVYRYTTNGRRILTPTKGINVVKYNNGSVKKVFVK